METGGDYKNVGDHNLQQTSQSTEQGKGSTSNNTGNSSHEPTSHGALESSPVQVMHRPDGSSTSTSYNFPSHVFSESNGNSQMEWSTASNESLFSIYMGNASFSNELAFKSGELDKPVNVAPSNKFNDISKRTQEQQLLQEHSSKAAEAKAAETMREVIMESSRTTENVGKGDDKASNSRRGSTESANSYAFQSSSKIPDKSVSSLSAAEKQSIEKSEENEATNAADQPPKAQKSWLSCLSCC